jgi:hypothetical protein
MNQNRIKIESSFLQYSAVRTFLALLWISSL